MKINLTSLIYFLRVEHLPLYNLEVLILDTDLDTVLDTVLVTVQVTVLATVLDTEPQPINAAGNLLDTSGVAFTTHSSFPILFVVNEVVVQRFLSENTDS